MLTLTNLPLSMKINATLTLNLVCDPLEQFDVLALPVIGGGLTNLAAILALNVLIMAA
jgi:hypothetical protein